MPVLYHQNMDAMINLLPAATASSNTSNNHSREVRRTITKSSSASSLLVDYSKSRADTVSKKTPFYYGNSHASPKSSTSKPMSLVCAARYTVHRKPSTPIQKSPSSKSKSTSPRRTMNDTFLSFVAASTTTTSTTNIHTDLQDEEATELDVSMLSHPSSMHSSSSSLNLFEDDDEESFYRGLDASSPSQITAYTRTAATNPNASLNDSVCFSIRRSCPQDTNSTTTGAQEHEDDADFIPSANRLKTSVQRSLSSLLGGSLCREDEDSTSEELEQEDNGFVLLPKKQHCAPSTIGNQDHSKDIDFHPKSNLPPAAVATITRATSQQQSCVVASPTFVLSSSLASLYGASPSGWDTCTTSTTNTAPEKATTSPSLDKACAINLLLNLSDHRTSGSVRSVLGGTSGSRKSLSLCDKSDPDHHYLHHKNDTFSCRRRRSSSSSLSSGGLTLDTNHHDQKDVDDKQKAQQVMMTMRSTTSSRSLLSTSSHTKAKLDSVHRVSPLGDDSDCQRSSGSQGRISSSSSRSVLSSSSGTHFSSSSSRRRRNGQQADSNSNRRLCSSKTLLSEPKNAQHRRTTKVDGAGLRSPRTPKSSSSLRSSTHHSSSSGGRPNFRRGEDTPPKPISLSHKKDHVAFTPIRSRRYLLSRKNEKLRKQLSRSLLTADDSESTTASAVSTAAPSATHSNSRSKSSSTLRTVTSSFSVKCSASSLLVESNMKKKNSAPPPTGTTSSRILLSRGSKQRKKKGTVGIKKKDEPLPEPLDKQWMGRNYLTTVPYSSAKHRDVLGYKKTYSRGV